MLSLLNNQTVIVSFLAAFSSAWNEIAASVLSCTSHCALDEMVEVSDENFLDVSKSFQSRDICFTTSCGEDLSGNIICLLKQDDTEAINSQLKDSSNDSPTEYQNIINSIFEVSANKLKRGNQITLHEASFDNFDSSNLEKQIGSSALAGIYNIRIGEKESKIILFFTSESSKEDHTPDSRAKNIDRLLDVGMDLVVRFGMTSMQLREIIRMGAGSMIELNRAVDEPVEILVDGHIIARGEVVVIGGYYGVRITEVTTVTHRTSFIGGE